ncbi:MAG TPA: FtsX-like permease family protein [Terriglobia bacterium]|nr:FtsX-like permease family protein [Terriglobia bacterium]HVB29454.1 FtsX-like permease family protein [Terriglobia bacterium]
MSESPEQTGKRRSLFWRLWFRSLVVRRPQAALALISLLVGATLASMLLNLYSDVHRKMTQEFRSYGANVILSSKGAASSGQASLGGLMDEAAFAQVESLRSKVHGLAAAPVLYLVTRISRVPAEPRLPSFENIVVVGSEFAALKALVPGWRVEAGAGDGPLEPGACAVGSHLARRFRLKPGDSVKLAVMQNGGPAESEAGPQTFHVVRVVSTGSSEDDQIFVPLQSLQRLAGLEGKISLVEINIPGQTAAIERGVHEMGAAFPRLEVRPIRQIVYSQGKVLHTIRGLLISLMSLILIIIALCVMATMTSIVLERRKDIAVMKALGASNQDVTRLFVMEGASLGLVAGLAGFIVGGFLAAEVGGRLFGVSLSVVWWTLPLVWGATILLAALATFFPVGMMRRIQPATALKGE